MQIGLVGPVGFPHVGHLDQHVDVRDLDHALLVGGGITGIELGGEFAFVLGQPVDFHQRGADVAVELGDEGPVVAEDLLVSLGVEVATTSFEVARVALRAFKNFGKRSAGRLNLGDCFAYALAEIEGDGLLFKGDDFPKTDVKSAL